MANYLKVPGFEDKTPENLDKSGIVNYLNDALIIYGPPCEWCANFDIICSKKFRPRKYALKFGPIESWHLRKNCKGFKEKEEESTEKEQIAKYVSLSLDCSAQQYGR